MAKILVVDDAPAVLDIVSQILRVAGHMVITATDASKALGQLRQNADLDVLICDIVLPDMPGAVLIRKALDRRPDMAVIAMTGYERAAPVRMLQRQTADRGTEEVWMLAGMRISRLLRKPFNDSTLLGAVTEALADPPGDGH
jgi:CheY-like chemotaxis protein